MRQWVAIGLCGIAVPAVSASVPVRRVEAQASSAQLMEALLPPEGERAWDVCTADCPTGIGALRVTGPALSMVGATVQARGKVHTDVALIGAVNADVVCTVVPELREGGQVHALGRGCRIERLDAGISSWLRRGVTATLEPALGVLLEQQLQEAPPYDLLTTAREGWLGLYGPDPSLRAPATSSPSSNGLPIRNP